MGTPGYFLILPCYVTSEFGLDIVYLSGYYNESSDCFTATDLFNFVRSIIGVSKLSTLRLHFAHLRFADPSSSFNIISNRALILHASLSWLSFFYPTILHGGYKPQRIRKGGIPMLFSLTGPCREIYYINFVRTHAPKQYKREQCHFYLTGSASVCTRRSSSAPGYQATFYRAWMVINRRDLVAKLRPYTINLL